MPDVPPGLGGAETDSPVLSCSSEPSMPVPCHNPWAAARAYEEAAAAAAVQAAAAASTGGAVGASNAPAPLLWGPGCLSLTSALGAQQLGSFKAPAYSAVAGGECSKSEETAWDGSLGPSKVNLASGLAADPWADAALGVAAPLLGRFGASASLQKSLEELFRQQSKMEFEAQRAAAAPIQGGC